MIIVTTPTGHIGSQVLQKLVEEGEEVRVLARDPSKIPASIRERVEILTGSLDNYEETVKAYQGADQLFFVIPPSSTYLNADDYYRGFADITCKAIKSAGIKRVVYISGTGLGVDKKAGAVYSSFIAEQMLEATGVALRILHCGTFMENLMHSVQPMRFAGEFSTTVPGDVKLPWVATKDIAEASVKLLRDSSWAGQGSAAVLGPEDLSYSDLGRIISKVLGKDIQYKTIADETLRATLKKFGASDAGAEGLIGIYSSMTKGTFNQIKRTSASTSPTRFQDWCEQVLKPAVNG